MKSTHGQDAPIPAVPIHGGYDTGKAHAMPKQSLRKSTYAPQSFVQHNYHDRSGELPERLQYITRGGVATLFPQKLHQVLDLMCTDGFAHVCSWQPHGRAFVVRKPREFGTIMPRYFGKMKYSSFQRQLNLYGFMRLTHGPDRGGYYHEYFLRGREFLCHRILRIRVKGKGSRSASNPDFEPNFYAMPPVDALTQAAAPLARALPQRALLSKQMSLNESDLVQALQAQPESVSTPLQRSISEGDLANVASMPRLGPAAPTEVPAPMPLPSAVNPTSRFKLEESLQDSMERLMGNLCVHVCVEQNSVGKSERDSILPPSLDAITTTLQTAEPAAQSSASLRTPSIMQEAPQLDGDVADFLKALFEDDDESRDDSMGGPPEGSKNAAVLAPLGTFSHHNSWRNAAA